MLKKVNAVRLVSHGAKTASIGFGDYNNELFKRYIARPVMVVVDVRSQTIGIPTDAYFVVEEIKDVLPRH